MAVTSVVGEDLESVEWRMQYINRVDGQCVSLVDRLV
jgi:hypothetical protein